MSQNRSYRAFIVGATVVAALLAVVWASVPGHRAHASPLGTAQVQSAGTGSPQGPVPRDAYAVATECAADLLGAECGARVPEFSWANIIQMCSASGEHAGDAAAVAAAAVCSVPPPTAAAADCLGTAATAATAAAAADLAAVSSASSEP